MWKDDLRLRFKRMYSLCCAMWNSKERPARYLTLGRQLSSAIVPSFPRRRESMELRGKLDPRRRVDDFFLRICHTEQYIGSLIRHICGHWPRAVRKLYLCQACLPSRMQHDHGGVTMHTRLAGLFLTLLLALAL